MTRPTDELARFVVEARWQDLPPEVVHEAKRSLVNHLATALGGCRDAAIDKAAKVMAPFTGPATATVIGRGECSDMLNAASLNAASANVFDFDDTHVPTILHPTAPVAPPLFAWAESHPMAGRDFLLAFVLGVEIECRLGNAVSPWHYNRGWHITSTCGVFGAAAAAAKAMRLDATGVGWAFGAACAQSSGLVETLGTMAKSIGVGNSARNGLVSALLARAGYSGPAEPLEGERGFLRVMGEHASTEALTGELGSRWEILANTYKPYPCGVVLNPVIEACLDLARSERIDPFSVEAVELVGAPLLRERTDRAPPATGRHSQVSARHAVAAALSRGRAGIADFSDEAVADPALRSFPASLTFVDDASLPVEAARVTVRLKGGRTLSAFVAQAKGSAARPLSDADLERKLAELSAHGGCGCDTAAIAKAVWDLDRSEDAAEVVRLAAGRRHA